jgi:hypothetical protein
VIRVNDQNLTVSVHGEARSAFGVTVKEPERRQVSASHQRCAPLQRVSDTTLLEG